MAPVALPLPPDAVTPLWGATRLARHGFAVGEAVGSLCSLLCPAAGSTVAENSVTSQDRSVPAPVNPYLEGLGFAKAAGGELRSSPQGAEGRQSRCSIPRTSTLGDHLKGASAVLGWQWE